MIKNRLITTFFLLFIFTFSYGQIDTKKNKIKNKFKFIEVKSNFGSFLYTDNALGESGLLDQGYGSVLLKLGWQSTNPDGWAAKYNYPSYGVGLYSGFLGDAKVYGNPNAVYAFINFPISSSSKKNVFSIEPSLGLIYNLNPFDSEENPLNESIGARAAVYFDVNVGFAYKFSRELDILYGMNFTHFSNGSTFLPNNGLNLYGLNLGIKYHYNPSQSLIDDNIYTNDVLPARFLRPTKSPLVEAAKSYLSLYIAGGVAQRDEDADTNTLYGVSSAVLDYEYHFNEMHAVSGGVDLFYDNRLRNLTSADRYLYGVHIGYDFMFYKFAVKFQIGTYLGDDKGKGSFFMRPAIRYNINKKLFAQVGLKTLAGGAADYIEYGIGFKPFKW